MVFNITCDSEGHPLRQIIRTPQTRSTTYTCQCDVGKQGITIPDEMVIDLAKRVAHYLPGVKFEDPRERSND